MSIELMRTISTACYVAAMIFLLIAIVLFFMLKIKDALGLATGITQKKAIAKIAAEGRSTEKAESITGEIPAVQEKKQKKTESVSGRTPEPIQAEQTTALPMQEETSLLSDAEISEDTTVLQQPADPIGDAGETTLLLHREETEFAILVEFSFLASREIIE